MRYRDKWPEYARQCDAMRVLPARLPGLQRYAQFAVEHKGRYLGVEQRTSNRVPWWLIAVLHRRESDADFNTYLGNGDPLNRPTVHVPAGRGPFPSFEDGAIDALHVDRLDQVVPPWPIEKTLYYCEIFNGLGYHARGLPSPYLWGGTNIQKPGKYIADSVFDPNVMDTQPGCAPIMALIAQLDKSVIFTRET